MLDPWMGTLLSPGQSGFPWLWADTDLHCPGGLCLPAQLPRAIESPRFLEIKVLFAQHTAPWSLPGTAMEKAPGENQQKQSQAVKGGCAGRGDLGTGHSCSGALGPLPPAQGQGEVERTPQMWQLPEMHLLTEAGAA